MPSLQLSESVERARLLRVESYVVHLDLTDEASFGSRSTIRFTCAEPGATTFAELADALEVTATLNGRPADHADGRVQLSDLAASNTLVVDARLPYVTDGDGMHVFVDPADGERYVSAYTAMDITSKVYCCFDQPDLKATLTLTVDADPRWTVLANGRELRRWGGHVEFARTPRIPPYLFVVCAGPWASERFQHAGLEFGWHARASQAAALARDAAELRHVTTACFDHYTSIFEPPYAFDSYDQVFVPGLNWAAQEQAGCITYRGEYLPDAPLTVGERMWRSSTIAHEMAHMWFGDLVTMRWWEDSWLNESFADFMGYDVADAAAGCTGARLEYGLQRKPTAYHADDRRSTHPVAEDAERMIDVDTAFGNFDMITYSKGNAVLRQLVSWLGESDFLAGVNRYLTAHAFANADLGDFLDALDGATERDVRKWADAWLRTTGYDTIGVERDDDVPVLHRDGTRPHRFHVAGYADDGTLVAERVVDLDDEPVSLPDLAGLAVIPDSRDETYARIVLDEDSRSMLTATLSDIESPLTRAASWARFADELRHGGLAALELLELAERHLPEEREPLIVAAVLEDLSEKSLATWLAPADLPSAEERLASLARDLLGSAEIDVWRAARLTLATVSSSPEDLRRLSDTAGADDVLRWRAFVQLAALGNLDPTTIDRELDRDRSTTAELGALTARAARPDAEAKAEAWSRMLADEVSNREFAALGQGLWASGQEEVTAPYVERYLAEMPDLARRRGQAFSQVIGWAFPRQAMSLEDLRDLREALAAQLAGDVPTVLRRKWDDRLDDLDATIRVRAAHE